MSGLNYLSLIIEARLSSNEVASQQTREVLDFEQYFECELKPTLSVWEERESTFAFLENPQSPMVIKKALMLTRLLRHSDEIIYEIKNLSKAREIEEKKAMAPELLLNARSFEELIFVETLHDEKLTAQVASLIGKTEQELIKDTLSVMHESLHQFRSAYQEQVTQFEVKNDQDSWLAYPCVSCKINKWSQHFDAKTFDFMEVTHPLVDRLLDQIYNAWSSLWETQTWAQQIDYHCEDNDEESDVQVWHELFEPFILKIATESIRALRDEDLIDDLNSCFTTLIDAKRPKDQRIGSFWIDESSPEHITVMFLTRDGKLLAQRDVTWDPSRVDSILEAFSIINIRILTYPEGLDQSYSEAFELLKTRYQLYPVSSVVLDPVPHPLSLTDNAQKALRIGQRFVAPLRFWARTDLIELMKCITTPKIIKCLEESNRLVSLQERLQDSCAERWLLLRQKRQNRKVRKSPNKKPHISSDQKDQNTHQSSVRNVHLEKQNGIEHIKKGAHVEAEVIKIDGYRADVQILNTEVKTYLKLKRKNQLKLGQIIQAQVVAIDAENNVRLRLKRNSNKPGSALSSSQEHVNSKETKSTLNRLNKLFASN